MFFELNEEQKRLVGLCRELAEDFATRTGDHDREASHPHENYDRLRAEGFLAHNIGKDYGGGGAGLFDHTLAYEALAEGCPATALAFNMHASMVGPLTESEYVPEDTRRYIAKLAVEDGKMIAGNFSEAASAIWGPWRSGSRAAGGSTAARCSPRCFRPRTIAPY